MAAAAEAASRMEFGSVIDPPLSTGIYGSLWTTNAFLPLIEKGIQKKIVHIHINSVGVVNKHV
jgi:hypothetical protein